MRIPRLPGVSALAAGVIAAGMLSPVSALAVDLRLELQVGTGCLSGDKPSASPIKVKLLRSDGKVLDSAHDDSSTDSWGLCLHRTPVHGNKLKMINGSAVRTVTVPDLTLEVDRVTSIVKGHGPAGKSVLIRWVDFSPAGFEDPVPIPVTANSHGRYHRDLSSSAIDVDGSDMIGAEYQDGHGDVFRRVTLAPYMEMTLPNKILVDCLPQGTTTVRLRTSGGTLRAARTFHVSGVCRTVVGSFKKNGHAVNIHVGDRITSDFASDAKLTWPTISVDGVGTTLSGRCIPNTLYGVSITRNGSTTYANGTTDPTGHFSETVGSAFQPGDHLELACETSRGDQVRLRRTL